MEVDFVIKPAKLIIAVGIVAALGGCGAREDATAVPPPSAHAQAPPVLAPAANHPPRLKPLSAAPPAHQ